MFVYLLQHSYEIEDFEETKIIGIYSSQKNAEEVKEKYKSLPGFKKYPDSAFFIDKYEVDISNWEEGFISWEEANKS